MKRRWPLSRGLYPRLLTTVLAVALLPLLLITVLGFTTARETLYRQTFDDLTAAAEARAALINRFFLERKQDISILASSPLVAESIARLEPIFHDSGIGSPDYQQATARIQPYLYTLKENSGDDALFLIAADGDIILTLAGEDTLGTNLLNGPYRESELAAAFKRAFTLLDVAFSDFKYYAPSNRPASFIAAPVYDVHRFIGVVAIQINADSIYTFSRDTRGLGESGEIVLAQRSTDAATILAPLKFAPDAAFKMQIAFDSKAGMPIQKAVQGERGAALSVDYRDEPILAVWRYLPYPNWGLVAKIDAREAFAPIRQLQRWTIAILITLVLAVVFAAMRLAHSITGPIQQLARGAERIGSGDLEHRLATDAQDEVGEMSRSFDTMVTDLKALTAAQVETEARRQESERARAEWHRVFDTIRSPLFLHDQAGRVVRANRAYVVEAKAEHDRVLGKLYWELFPKGDGPLPDCAAGGSDPKPSTVDQHREELTLADGRTFLSHSMSAGSSTQGEPLYVHWMYEITELRNTEAALEASNHELNSALTELHRTQSALVQTEKLSALGTLAAGVAHEINNPLMALVNYVQYACRHTEHARSAEILGKAEDELHRIKTIVQNMLIFAHPSDGGSQAVNLIETLQQTLALISADLRHHQITIKIDFPEALPAVDARKNAIQQVLLNLLINARDAIGESDKREIRVESSVEERQVCLAITDSGPGIAEEVAERLFDPFVTTKPVGKGTGLGLSVSRSIIEGFGGTLQAENNTTGGACFHICLPKWNH
jgi:C4-dicarboxylate-specific signal transduction histidine kinase